MVNYVIKSQLAKLLATEDIVVEHRSVRTAQFDVEKRVLTLPLWKKASSIVYDMLVGHEVGHALFTPNEWDYEVPRQFVNVTEDARIEKLMKRKYPGISKSFFGGYKELSDDDFFELEGQDISKMNLADRINLYFKIGNFINITFNSKEQDIVDMVAEAETFADAILAAEMMYKYCKDEAKSKSEVKEDESSPVPGSQPQSSPSGGVQNIDDPNPDESDQIEEEKQQQQQEERGEEDVDDFEDDIQVETDDAFTQGTQDLNDLDSNHIDNIYCEVPDVNLDNVIVSNQEIKDTLKDYWAEQLKPMTFPNGHVGVVASFENCDDIYNKFKNSAQKEVNYLVKEFETRKSADAYARSSSSRTGVLDTAKLHTYKFNEDLFKKVTVTPDGKNHGLIFILDWSGSMGEYLIDTLKQMYNLIWFCDKVNIPFDVYAFTNNFGNPDPDSPNMKIEVGKLYVDDHFKLLNYVTSGGTKADLNTQLLNLWRLAYGYCHYAGFTTPAQFGLSGTPLNESIVCLHKIIPAFKKKHNIQKVQCVVLSDGEANALQYLGTYNHFATGEVKIAPKQMRSHVHIRNRKTGYTYKVGYTHHGFTQMLLDDLKQSFPDTNLIGIRLITPRDFRSFISRYNPVNEEQLKKHRKDKFCSIKGSGYHSYFAMLTSALSNDVDFDVDEGASKVKIKSAFIKSLKSKSLNKKVLGEFISLVV